jgi:N-acetylglucosaminyldiphosphoundecaprenol N-acetyl-beta-D-mannosaminyltransferase
MHSLQYLPLLGTRIASVTYDEAVSLIIERAATGRAHAYVCAANVHSVSMARRSAKFREVLNGSLLTVPDGKPLIWAQRILGGRKLTERVYCPTLMLKLCEAAAARGLPIYLYGGKEGVVENLAKALTKRYPGLKVAGTYSPPFGERAADDPALLRELDAINASGCRLVFVSLGAPKQEWFMQRHAARLVPVQDGVGAAFDFHSGRVAQAPEWMQESGLEWLFRFCAEPRRLWRRYLFYNPYFVARVLLQRLGLDGPSRDLTKALANVERPVEQP